MKRRLFVLLAMLALAAGALVFSAKKGYCVYCPSYTCYNQATCGQCRCVVGPGGSAGHCYGW